TSTPARANRKPAIIPAGPPPAMQQRAFIVDARLSTALTLLNDQLSRIVIVRVNRLSTDRLPANALRSVSLIFQGDPESSASSFREEPRLESRASATRRCASPEHTDGRFP